jgi:hypothetical protein
MAYFSPSDVALFMNITLDESGEAYLTALIPQIEAAVEAARNRTWNITDEQSETFDGGVTRLFSRSTPMSAVSSLVVNGPAVTRRSSHATSPHIEHPRESCYCHSESSRPAMPRGAPAMTERPRETCNTCGGSGRVVDESQAGEPVATCMTCKGNGWVYRDKK